MYPCMRQIIYMMQVPFGRSPRAAIGTICYLLVHNSRAELFVCNFVESQIWLHILKTEEFWCI